MSDKPKVGDKIRLTGTGTVTAVAGDKQLRFTDTSGGVRWVTFDDVEIIERVRFERAIDAGDETGFTLGVTGAPQSPYGSSGLHFQPRDDNGNDEVHGVYLPDDAVETLRDALNEYLDSRRESGPRVYNPGFGGGVPKDITLWSADGATFRYHTGTVALPYAIIDAPGWVRYVGGGPVGHNLENIVYYLDTHGPLTEVV